MNAKEYLEEVKKYDTTLNHLKDELRRIDSALGVSGISYDREPSHGTPNPNRRESLIIRRLDIIERIEDEIESVTAKRLIIWRNLNNWLEANELMIIKYRYFDYLQWQDIAIKANYSEKRCYEINNKALDKINNYVSKC